MGMGGSKSAPDTPDLSQLISTGVGGNWGMTSANNRGTLFGTSSPYGETSWVADRNAKGNVRKYTYTDPYTGEKYKDRRFEQKITLSPEEQQKYDLSNQAQISALGKANDLMGTMGNFGLDNFDFTRSLGDIGGNIYQPGKDLSGEAWSGDPLKLGNEATEKRLYELGSSFLDPRFAQEQATLEARAAERGIPIGSEAYRRMMEGQADAKTRAYNDLLLGGRAQATDELSREWQSGLQGNQQRFGQLAGARGLGMAEQGQQFGQSQTDRARQLAERGQYTGEQFGQQGLNIQSLAQLLGAGQPNMPQFTGSSPQGSPYFDYPGAINTNWDQQFKAWAQEQQNKGNMMGGAMSGIASIIGSDERIKDNIKQVGKTAEGLPIYEFSIGDGDMQTGVMAQDVEKVDPSAVVTDPSTGIKGVNYDQAVGDGTGTYTVEKGDNIWDIGERLGVDPQAIIAANPDIQNPDFIVPGQQLVVPGMAAPGPEAVPLAALSALPAAGAATGIPAVASALAGPAAPPRMSTNIEDRRGWGPLDEQALRLDTMWDEYTDGPRQNIPPAPDWYRAERGWQAAPPMTEPVSAPPPAAAGGLTPEQMQTIMELKRRFPDLQLPAGGMGSY